MSTREELRGLAKTIDVYLTDTTGEPLGFCLITFPFGSEGISTYTSNADRSDMIAALKETVERLEADQAH